VVGEAACTEGLAVDEHLSAGVRGHAAAHHGACRRGGWEGQRGEGEDGGSANHLKEVGVEQADEAAVIADDGVGSPVPVSVLDVSSPTRESGLCLCSSGSHRTPRTAH